jgi:hypothetical protein
VVADESFNCKTVFLVVFVVQFVGVFLGKSEVIFEVLIWRCQMAELCF